MESGATSELAALKTKLRATWIAGDFHEIARYYADQAEDFVKRLDLKPGMKVLDVACGTGNLAIPAARTGADVTGVDIAPLVLGVAVEVAGAATSAPDRSSHLHQAIRLLPFRSHLRQGTIDFRLRDL